MFEKKCSDAVVEMLKLRYPSGTNVRLLRMDDVQAPPVGTRGVVQFVDDIGNIGVAWENGSSLNVVFGVDAIETIGG